MGELIFQSIDGRTSVTDILDHSQIVLPDRDWGGEFRVCLPGEEDLVLMITWPAWL